MFVSRCKVQFIYFRRICERECAILLCPLSDSSIGPEGFASCGTMMINMSPLINMADCLRALIVNPQLTISEMQSKCVVSFIGLIHLHLLIVQMSFCKLTTSLYMYFEKKHLSFHFSICFFIQINVWSMILILHYC